MGWETYLAWAEREREKEEETKIEGVWEREGIFVGVKEIEREKMFGK